MEYAVHGKGKRVASLVVGLIPSLYSRGMEW